ncbi:MAG: hypothetical protein GWO24_09870 [Akkermansiaceae bacterium]|nr:hypothetical protein [Akkermansiaceae bacterium]
MAHAIAALELGKEGVGLGPRDSGGRLSAVGGDKVDVLGVVFEQPGNVGAAAFLEGFENPGLVLTALLLVGSPKPLVHVSVEVDFHLRTDAILEFLHRGQ